MLSVEIMENQIIFTKEQIIKIVNYGKNGVYLYSATLKGFAMAVFMRKDFSKPLLQNLCYL